MKYRLATIQSTTTLTDDKTDTYNINLQDPISRIVIHLRGTNADSVPDGHPAKAVSKIELVDGSDVLYSLSGEEAQAVDFYDTKITPLNVVSYVNANVWTCVINMNFGRWIWDSELALDPKRFKNLQLKVTHKVADTAGSSSSSSTSSIAIFADVFDQKSISPRGFLMNKEIKAYTIGSNNSYEYTDMPTDYIYRRVMIQALYVGNDITSVVKEFKLSEDNDKRIPFDISVSSYMKIIAPEYGLWEEALPLNVTASAVAHFTAVDYEYRLGHLRTNDVDTTAQLNAYPLGGRMYVIGEGAGEAVFSVEGYGPHGCVPVFCGNNNIVEDWYDVKRIGSLVMRTKAGSLGGTATARICVQQFRTY